MYATINKWWRHLGNADKVKAYDAFADKLSDAI